MNLALTEFLSNLQVDRGLAAAYAADREAVLAESTLCEDDKAILRTGASDLAFQSDLLEANPGF